MHLPEYPKNVKTIRKTTDKVDPKPFQRSMERHMRVPIALSKKIAFFKRRCAPEIKKRLSLEEASLHGLQYRCVSAMMHLP